MLQNQKSRVLKNLKQSVQILENVCIIFFILVINDQFTNADPNDKLFEKNLKLLTKNLKKYSTFSKYTSNIFKFGTDMTVIYENMKRWFINLKKVSKTKKTLIIPKMMMTMI